MTVFAGTPRLLCALLIARNRKVRASGRNFIVTVCCVGAIAMFVWHSGAIGPALDWLDESRLASAAASAIAAAIWVARRRVLKRMQFARSWLAAVPVRKASARCEALFIEMLPATAVIASLTLICAPHWPLWAYLSGGIAIGSIASYAIPAPKIAEPPPGSRYVPHNRAKNPGKVRPSLRALGHWPLRQMFAWAQPKMVARATIPVLLSMPMGTMADTAMAVVGFFAAAGALLLLVSAAFSAGAKLRRWMAPLPVRAVAQLRFFLSLTLCAIAGLSAALSLLLLLMRS